MNTEKIKSVDLKTTDDMPKVPMLKDLMQQFDKNLEVPEIRVWNHPERIGKEGDDYFKVFKSFDAALNYIRRNPKLAESVPLIALRGWEMNIFDIAELDYAEENANFKCKCGECGKELTA